MAEGPEPGAKKGRRYRYGYLPTWRIVINAVHEMGRPVTPAEVLQHVTSKIPDFERGNISPDLSVASVNSYSRGNHGVNSRPRRSDTGNRYDVLFRIGSGKGVRYVPYDPARHGVWELYETGEKVLRTRQVTTPDDIELDQMRESLRSRPMFDPAELQDERKRVLASMVVREGQPAFREKLLAAYGNVCAVSGCMIRNLLEAAHIDRYKGSDSNVTQNGLPLRADLHKLYDLHLFYVDPETLTIRLSDILLDSEYAGLEGKKLHVPLNAADAPSLIALQAHRSDCAWADRDDVKGSQPTVDG